MSKPEQLTTRQRRAIDALLTARNVTAAATAVGVSRRTIERWMQSAIFRDSLRQAQGEVIGATVRRLASATGLAVDTLVIAMTRKETEDADRVRAANITLSRLPQLLQLADFEERLAALEQAQGAADGHSK